MYQGEYWSNRRDSIQPRHLLHAKDPVLEWFRVYDLRFRKCLMPWRLKERSSGAPATHVDGSPRG
jgi:hypothetical protein